MVKDQFVQPLSYASADPAVLRPGERLLWEGGTLARRHWWHRSVALPAFRITTARAFCVTPRPRYDRHRAPVALPVTLAVVADPRRGPSTIELGPGLWLVGLDDWRTPARVLAGVPRPPRRRRRRTLPGRPPAVTTPLSPLSPPLLPPPLPREPDPHDLALLPDERVLWSGRGHPRAALGWPAVRHKLGIVAWLAVPAGLVAWDHWVLPPGQATAAVATVAGLWLVMALYRLTVVPLRRRWHLARCRYVLTTRRAFAISPHHGGRRIAFVFLDALPATFARQHWPDGFGDVAVNPAVAFDRVADPAAVHSQLVDAVLTARRDLPDLGWADLPSHPNPDD